MGVCLKLLSMISLTNRICVIAQDIKCLFHTALALARVANICIIYAEYVHVDVEQLAEFNVREPARLFKIRSIAFSDGNNKICNAQRGLYACACVQFSHPKWV